MKAPMITAIIETKNDEVRLAHALAALVPAATEGIVRDVVVIDHGSSDGTVVVADAAGCAILNAMNFNGDPRQRAASEARGDWLLFLSPSVTLAPNWLAETMAFIDHALVTGKAQERVATFRGGRIDSGWIGWLRSFVNSGDGLLIAKTAYLASVSSSPSSAASRVSGARRGAA